MVLTLRVVYYESRRVKCLTIQRLITNNQRGQIWKNRNFLKIKLGNSKHKALFDSGARVSLICGKKMAKRFQDKLKPVESVIESALGTDERFGQSHT